MLVTTNDLSNFSGVHPDNDNLQKIYIGTATDLIKTYVGFDPEVHEEFKKDVEKHMILYSENGIIFYTDEDMTIEADIPDDAEITPTLIENQYDCKYVVNEVVVPDIFKLVCLEISALMQMEESENLGVNSKSFGDSGSRTFLNVVDYTPYLKKLNKFRTGDPFKF